MTYLSQVPTLRDWRNIVIRYVKKRWTTPLFKAATGDDSIIDLLWGDRVRVIDQAPGRWKVKARGLTGYVKSSHIGKTSYLELYFIDVGQGDGVLIRTPDDKHILIDGGWPRKSQPTGKNAADFVDWKFKKDYEGDTIELDAVICSHNDQDHYGGLWDLLDEKQKPELDTEKVCVEAFYHAGLSWWKTAGGRTLGPSKSTPDGDMWVRLLRDRASVIEGLKSGGSQPKLQGEWASFLRKVRDATARDGTPTPVARLHSDIDFIPGFDESSKVSIQVLAPVEFDVDNEPAIRKFSGGTSKNTNGNSVLLKLKYKSARILLTGDLNTASQHSLLADYAQEPDVFKCDVAKSCHHGSGDVSLKFLEAVQPACTIISSGDSEGHDHPRPNIIAASGLTGFRTEENDSLITPLVYSTELARSIALGKVHQLDCRDTQSGVITEVTGDDLGNFKARYKITMAGARAPKSGSSKINKRRVAARTTYGLINVRTDGKTIMCAALNEKNFTWNVSTFKSRFD